VSWSKHGCWFPSRWGMDDQKPSEKAAVCGHPLKLERVLYSHIHTIHYTLHTTQYILYTIYYVLYTIYYILYNYYILYTIYIIPIPLKKPLHMIFMTSLGVFFPKSTLRCIPLPCTSGFPTTKGPLDGSRRWDGVPNGIYASTFMGYL
jgi:hypothetical protein